MDTTFHRAPHFRLGGLLAAAMLLFAVSSAQPVCAQEENPGIVPVGAGPLGLGYAEWAAEWWRWALSLPLDGHPLLDETGENCDAGQAGQLWFLGGTFTTTEVEGVVIGEAERTCHVPAGTFLFFPVVNVLATNIGAEPPSDDAELEATAAFLSTGIADAFATIDGRPVQNLENFLIFGDAFEFDYVEDGLVGTAEGGSSRGADAGIYLLLAPLSVGEHTVDFGGSLVFTQEEHGFDFMFFLDIQYDIVVLPKD
jgi:hypothetical protein